MCGAFHFWPTGQTNTDKPRRKAGGDEGRKLMREVIEKVSIGYGVTYVASILYGFPWDRAAAFLTCVWFAWLMVDKAILKIRQRKEGAST